ncbi:DUF3889 domain-containing protein [Metabacillus sp. RGM 3146]|uniref:DUF3889 domain-containing protein n=1 Tax=Metabacillus sp. RGM 3146 TaxID=3401092 RepID=UPI003B9CCE1E
MITWIICLNMLCQSPGTAAVKPVITETRPPEYAKWSRIALKKTEEKYPKAEIVDYLHIGREKIGFRTAKEKFKLWMREDGKEYGLYVTVEFDTETEGVKSITFQKTDR